MSPGELIQEFEALREQRIGLISESLEHTDPLALLADVANIATALYISLKINQPAAPTGFISNSKRYS